MHRLTRRRPSGATAIALVALFASLGGSAYAASQITGADVAPRTLTWRNIARHSIGYGEVARLTGQNVRKSSMGGWQVDESTLAKVPSAAKADTATSADSAKNADALGGQPASAYLPSGTVVRLGLLKLTDGQTKQLYQSGPVTITARCTNAAGGDEARIFATTTEDHSLLVGHSQDLDFGTATPEASSAIADTGTQAHGTSAGDARVFEVTTPSGTTVHGQMTAGVNVLGNAGGCQYTGYAVIG